MAVKSSWVEIPLPRDWLDSVKSAFLQVVSLARFAIIHTRGWAANSSNARARLQAEVEQAQNEVLLLGEEMRIKDARMAVLDPHRMRGANAEESGHDMRPQAARCEPRRSSSGSSNP